jgi:hypothetical protein
MNNGVGVAPVGSMLRAASRSAWETMVSTHGRNGGLLSAARVHHRDPRRMGGFDVAQMAIYSNAALANVFFPAATIGQLIPGAVADMIL